MSNSTQLSRGIQSSTTPWKSVGIWMSGFIMAYILFNSVRATLNPAEFAQFFGIPSTGESNIAFVYVYAIRSFFLGVFGFALLLSRSYKTLTLYAMVAVLMPLGDAVLVAVKGGAIEVIARHGLTAGFLVLTWFFLRRWTRATAAQGLTEK